MDDRDLNWRDGRAVEGAALEMLFRGNFNEGSNPSLSVPKASHVYEVLFITEYRSQDSEFRRLLLFIIFSPAPHLPITHSPILFKPDLV